MLQRLCGLGSCQHLGNILLCGNKATSSNPRGIFAQLCDDNRQSVRGRYSLSKKKNKSKPDAAVSATIGNIDVAPTTDASPHSPTAEPWPTWLKVVISSVVCLHLLVVFWAPLTFNTRGRAGESPVTNDVMWLFQPYADFFYLNQGYAFFAPDPGPSHLMEYRIDGQAGDPKTVDARRFPSRGHRFPRLHYHRHFMLAEWLNMGFTDPLPLAGPIDPNHRRAHALYHDLKKSFEEHLEYELGVEQVEVVRVEHRQPSPPEFAEEKIGIDDARLFLILPEDGPPTEILNPPTNPTPQLRPQDPPLGPVPGPPFDPTIPFGPIRPPTLPPIETVPTPQTDSLPGNFPQAVIESVPVPTPEPEGSGS